MAIESGDKKCLIEILDNHSEPESMINNKDQAVLPLAVAAKKERKF